MKHPVSFELESLCRLRLDQFSSLRGGDSLPLPPGANLPELVEIVSKNLTLGRLDRQNRLRAPTRQLTLEAYIDRVIQIWSGEQPRWCRLQAHDPETWRWLEQDLRRAAGPLLGMRSRLGSAALTVEDYVQRACLNVLRANFHFDMPLLVWARAILKNTIREPDRSHDALDQWHFSLDAPFAPPTQEGSSFASTYTDAKSEQALEQVREREAILQNLAKLTALRQAVVILTFFEGMSDSEIAERLDISLSHLYSTRHRALRQLCDLMKERHMQD